MSDDILKRPVILVDDKQNKTNLDELVKDLHAVSAVKGTGPITGEQLRRSSINALYESSEHFDLDETARMLAIQSNARKVGMDETIDLKAASAGGRTPTFHVLKKTEVEKFERAMVADPTNIKLGGFDSVIDRLARTLRQNPDQVVDDAAHVIVDIVKDIPEERRWPLVQQAFYKVQRADARRRLKELNTKYKLTLEALANAKRRHAETVNNLAALEHIASIAKTPVLQRLSETGFHKCVSALRDGRCILGCPAEDVGEQLEALVEIEQGDFHSFVVQHDWAQAFAKAADFSTGDFKLPYHASVFEFRISGSRVCFSIDSNGDEHPSTSRLYVETPFGWALAAQCKWDTEHWRATGDLVSGLLTLCADQVRAISIALDAEVAETEIVRAPHRLNRKREAAGKVLILDYHLIDLSRRVRYTRRLPEVGDLEVEKVRRRLHFVRGHTRHYPNHKIWIRWHLRGDPDLGFIDKHYKL